MNITARFTNESIEFKSELGNNMNFERVLKTIISNRYNISLGEVKVNTYKDDMNGIDYFIYSIKFRVQGENFKINTHSFLYHSYYYLERFFSFIFSELSKFDRQLEESKIYFNVAIDGTKFEVTNKDEKTQELEDRLQKYEDELIELRKLMVENTISIRTEI